MTHSFHKILLCSAAALVMLAAVPAFAQETLADLEGFFDAYPNATAAAPVPSKDEDPVENDRDYVETIKQTLDKYKASILTPLFAEKFTLIATLLKNQEDNYLPEWQVTMKGLLVQTPAFAKASAQDVNDIVEFCAIHSLTDLYESLSKAHKERPQDHDDGGFSYINLAFLEAYEASRARLDSAKQDPAEFFRQESEKYRQKS